MAEKNVFVYWSNFAEHTSKAFLAFRHETALHDVTLYCEGHFITAHKLLLANCSGYFKRLFLENPNPYHLIRLENFQYKNIMQMIDFMYEGMIMVAEGEVAAFQELAAQLEVPFLHQMVRTGSLNTGEVNGVGTSESLAIVSAESYFSPIELALAMAQISNKEDVIEVASEDKASDQATNSRSKPTANSMN
uniref:BTB domain-containing protein n=1 Tax=Anopheles epiroticus TaxID=199890 RepID=A0A182PAT4_9DIPT